MRIATIDLGTNTFLLLIAECIGGALRPVHQEQAFVRLLARRRLLRSSQ